MNKFVFITALAACCSSVFAEKIEREEFDAQKDPPAIVQWAKGHAPAGVGKPVKSPNLIYHGGPIMPTTQAMAIFWGTKWAGSDLTFQAAEKIAGIDSFYSEVGGSNYAKSNSEYTQSDGQKVTSNITYLGHRTDFSVAPSKAPSTGAILGEVCKVISESGLQPQTNGFYAVYTDTKRGSAGYCAWHSAGTCNGKTVQFSFYFNLDGDSGCSVGQVGNQPQGLSAIVNVSGHELSEAMTDPQLNAWYDAQGAENADKCAWTFSGNLLMQSGWKIQGNWSNYAYNNNMGSPRGCIDGSGGLPPGVQ